MKRPAFWAKVKRGAPDECWSWLGFKRSTGHGLTSYKGMMMHASRKAWILTHGSIPGDLCVNHRCDNAACCNPDHLYLGTRADNMIDLWMKTAAQERTQRGRPHVLTIDQLSECYQLRRQGMSLKECAARYNVHLSTICRLVTSYRRALLAKRREDRMSNLGRKVHTSI